MNPDDLYGLPLERFVPERTGLVSELRKAGRRSEAGEVAALRKPSIAAWAVNQLVRTQSRGFDELLASGDALRGAHAELIAGRGDGRALRSASERERAAVDALTKAARGLLSSEGNELSTTVVDRVSDTLHAAALDGDARAQVKDGTLVRELRHAGLGTLADTGSGPVENAVKPAPVADENDDVRARRARAAEQRAAAKLAERERAEARRDARVNESEARRQADLTTRALRSAQERRDRAAEALQAADEALAKARVAAESAAESHRGARAALDAF